MSFSATAQIDRSVQPTPEPAPKVKLGKVKKFTLNNGLKVIMVENHKLPRASASLTIDFLPYAEGNKKGVSSMMGSLLGRGTTHITKDEFNEKVDFLGANIGFYSSGASARSLKKYFPEILELMADGVKNSQFTQEEFDKEVRITLDHIKSKEKNVTYIARRVEDALLYGKTHPYGEFITEKSIKNISLQDIKNNFKSYYIPNNAYLVIVGDINPKAIKKLVKKIFKDWKKGIIPVSNILKPQNVTTTEIDFINMPNAIQSEILVANNTNLKLGDKDYYATLLANAILGGGGGARLFLNLREDKAYTYGSYSQIDQDRYAATFRATASVRNVVTDSSVVEIQKEINKIRYQKVTAEELKNAKAKYIGSFVRTIQKPATTARITLNIARYNLPSDFYENYLSNINSVTINDVQNASIKHFKGDKARIIITGKAIDVLKNLEKTVDYKINYFDKFGNPANKPKMSLPIPAGVTATTVVNAYFKAIGGKDKVMAVKTLLMESTTKVQGMNLSLVVKTATPNKQSEIVFMAGNVLSKQVFDGTKGYSEGRGQHIELKGKQLEQVKSKTAPFEDLAYAKGTLKRIEPINGKNAYVIVVGDTEVFYNTVSGLKVKSVTTTKVGGKEIKTPSIFKDYKEVNGIKFPHKILKKMGPMDVIFKIKKIKINEGVSDKDFK